MCPINPLRLPPRGGSRTRTPIAHPPYSRDRGCLFHGKTSVKPPHSRHHLGPIKASLKSPAHHGMLRGFFGRVFFAPRLWGASIEPPDAERRTSPSQPMKKLQSGPEPPRLPICVCIYHIYICFLGFCVYVTIIFSY